MVILKANSHFILGEFAISVYIKGLEGLKHFLLLLGTEETIGIDGQQNIEEFPFLIESIKAGKDISMHLNIKFFVFLEPRVIQDLSCRKAFFYIFDETVFYEIHKIVANTFPGLVFVRTVGLFEDFLLIP